MTMTALNFFTTTTSIAYWYAVHPGIGSHTMVGARPKHASMRRNICGSTWPVSCISSQTGISPIELNNGNAIYESLLASPEDTPKANNLEKEQIQKLVREIKENLQSMNDGKTSPSAYDTAWVARIPSTNNQNEPQFPATLTWILNNQHEDGSWGEPAFFLLYDRLVCTLACVLTLTIWKKGQNHVTNGLNFLRNGITNLVEEPPSLRTCGFEIVFPSMLGEARSLGLSLPYELPYLSEISALREKKIGRIPSEMMHSVHTTLLYSLEALQEIVDWEKIIKLKSRDGSFLSSPSSTAVAYMKTGDRMCLEFLTISVRRFGDNVPCQYPIDLLERIWAVDTIQRLGIDHYFCEEISDILDYIYRCMGKKGISWGRDNPVADIDDTCMALRLLRTHGYAISPDVLEYFKDKDGKFICFVGETHQGVSDMFNLYRFTQVAFPGETILKEAKAFVEEYLKTSLANNQLNDKWSLKKSLHKEVEYALTYPWKMRFQKLEAREYIDQYGEHDVWIAKTVYWMYNVNNPKYLKLAKLDYNDSLNAYHEEHDSMQRWWNENGLNYPTFEQICPKEIYFSIAATLSEPEFSAARIAYSKCNCIENIIQDLFQSQASLHDLKAVCQAVEKWDPLYVEALPLAVKIGFEVMYSTLNDLAVHINKAQGKDMFPYLHNLRTKQIQAYLQAREMKELYKAVTMEEYIENGKRVVGLDMRVLPAIFLMGEHVRDHVLQCVDNRSKIHDQVSFFLRLFIDVKTYKRMRNSENISAVDCYMKQANCSEQEAMNDLHGIADDAFEELVREFLKPSQVPRSCRRLLFEHARITQFFLWNHNDTTSGSKDFITDAVEYFFSPI